MSVISVNVRSLSSRLSLLLSWGFDILIVSEARVASMRSLARVAKAGGYDTIFGPPPPPSPTFAVSPGGLAVFSKLPISLRKLHPLELEQWDASGRLVVVQVVHGKDGFVIVAVYGFPLSHGEHGTNESLLTDALAMVRKDESPCSHGRRL